MGTLYIGTAGWAIPRGSASEFSGTGTHLERYSRVFTSVEINSTFHCPHKRSTYERWATATPAGFRFSVKAPKEITHLARLRNVHEPLVRFLEEVSGLGDRLGPILFQLPPSLEFNAAKAGRFLELLQELHSGWSVLEPRHHSWFEEAPADLLKRFRLARVAADPALVPPAAEPGGWTSLAYFRLHGTPRVYYSAYPREFLQNLVTRILSMVESSTVWCIFDNTAAGAATGNALTVLQGVTGAPSRLCALRRKQVHEVDKPCTCERDLGHSG